MCSAIIEPVTTVLISRGPRPAAPELPSADVTVPPPPALPVASGSRWHQALLALPMLAGTIATAMMFAGRDGGPYTYLVGGIFGLSSLGMLATAFTGAGRQRRVDTEAVRRAYARQLDEARRQVRLRIREQASALEYRHPAPETLWSLVGSPRIWERRPDDADHGVIRIGRGPQPPLVPLRPPMPSGGDELEPASVAALDRFLAAHALIPDLPVALTLLRFRTVHVCGPGAHGLVRAMIAGLTVFHSPADVAVAVCADPAEQHRWEYVKWLPHARHPQRRDAAGPARLMVSSAELLGRALAGITATTIVVYDGVAGTTGDRRIVIGEPPAIADAATIAITVERDGRMTTDGGGGPVDAGIADHLPMAEAEVLARALAPLRPAGGMVSDDGPSSFGELVGIGDPQTFDPAAAWPGGGTLRVPIGMDGAGHPVMLDLNESALDGMGPHGLVIGATGSGKSELLRSLVLGLAATHDSAVLNFVLIDFKGGATFATLDQMPHTAAVITNLADQLALVDRMADALNGELIRRQELLRDAGNVASIHEYQRLRATDPSLAALPALLVVCDEFSELLSAKPEFIDLFVAMGRLGRSLGVHLLLASQRLDEGRLRGLETHLSYRIGLRTFSAVESRAVLGVASAYELPREPGHGYLRSGTEPLVRFKAAYVSGPAALPKSADPDGVRVVPFTAAPVGSPAAPPPSEPAAPSTLDLLVRRMTGAGRPAHQIWLPPLGRPEPLDRVIGALGVIADRGLATADDRGWRRLRTPIGVIDRPRQQRRDPLVLELDGAAGHVAVVGAPQAGKSTAIRTLLATLALTHTPREATCYCLDFGGGTLRDLARLPHVGAVIDRQSPSAVRRCVGEIASILADRERRFVADAVAGVRQARGGTALDPYGDVFLVIDGWATIRSEFDDLEPIITDLAARGLSYGIHVVISTGRWADLRPNLRDLLTSRLELRLGDVSESIAGRHAAMSVPERSPGRGILADGAQFQLLAPELSSGTDLIGAIAAAWPGPSAPPVRELPALVPLAAVSDPEAGGLRVPLGLDEAGLAPVRLDFAADPHLLIFGDSGSGKSALLRSLATSISNQMSPDKARIVVIDYRRSLLGEIAGDHLIGYASAAGPAVELIESVAAYMRARLPGPDVTTAQLKARSWYQGPDCFVLVDDWDLTGPAPFASLLDLLGHARDIGLHLVVARRCGGAARALYEPTLARLKELASTGVVLSGDSDEGPLLGGVRPRRLPPGRGYLIHRRDGARLVQLGYAEPHEAGSEAAHQ